MWNKLAVFTAGTVSFFTTAVDSDLITTGGSAFAICADSMLTQPVP